tara:strand:+ start:438 stop:1076 length:639 start_codon:yes stop_codon:yes gene_type:complete
MEKREINHIVLGILTLTAIVGFSKLIEANYSYLLIAFGFAAITIGANILTKKLIASSLDADVKHELWTTSMQKYKPHQRLKKPILSGILFPLAITALTLGLVKVPTILTYETEAKKIRAAKRHGYYSFTEMTEWHNALIGASGIMVLLILSIIAYIIPSLQGLPKILIYYAFFNMLPISKLDGTQIYFGSRTLWTTLAIVTSLFTAAVLIIP